MSDWSPERLCPTCGAPVQLYSGPRRQFPTTVIAGTMERHYHAEPTRGELRECPDCERVPVYIYEGIAYGHHAVTLPMQEWKRHECRTEPTPIAAPVKVEMARRPLSAIPDYALGTGE